MDTENIADTIRDLLVHVTLYQHGLYDNHMLNKELDNFLHVAEKYVCNSVRINGGICYPELLEEYGNPTTALEELRSQIANMNTLGNTGKYIADMLLLSYDI